MNVHHPGRFDRRAAEDMLRGKRVEGVDGRLGDLLHAAAAPAPDGELPGERAALAAFRTAHRATAAQPQPHQASGSWSVLRRHRLKLIMAAAAATMALAGTAAAVTGTLPIGFPGSPPGSGTPGHQLSTTTPPTRPTDSNGGSIRQLCQRYNGSSESDRRTMLADPAFGPLVHAAGGSQNVPGYCARPSSSDQPRSRPDTGGDTSHPAGPSGRQQGNQSSSQSSAPPR